MGWGAMVCGDEDDDDIEKGLGVWCAWRIKEFGEEVA